jgi:threonine dehydrogenase-like Zn-dependent dehydrogenase
VRAEHEFRSPAARTKGPQRFLSLVVTDATDARDSHSDVHSAYGDTPMSTDIAGHEGVGHVVKRTSLPGH